MTTNSAGYAGESPETRPESIGEQVKRIFESDQEPEQFLAHVYAARHADLA